MRVIYKLNDRKKDARLEKGSYQVLGFGIFDDKRKIFLIANDDLHFIAPDESVLEIIEDDLTDYLRMDNLNYGKTFFVDKILSSYIVGFENYIYLTINNIWTLSKLSKFFTDNNYLIPDNYRDTVLSVKYKMNLIEGFLMFANSYINNKNKGGDYWDELFFYSSTNLDDLVSDKFKNDKKVVPLDTKNYKSLLKEFIGKHLYDEIANEGKSTDLCTQLFNLINSIFINGIDKIYAIETFYDECFVIESVNTFYCLNKSWGS